MDLCSLIKATNRGFFFWCRTNQGVVIYQLASMLASALVLLAVMSQAKAGDFLLRGGSQNLSVVTEVDGPEGSTLKVLSLPTASSFITPLSVQSGELGCTVIAATGILAIRNITYLEGLGRFEIDASSTNIPPQFHDMVFEVEHRSGSAFVPSLMYFGAVDILRAGGPISEEDVAHLLTVVKDFEGYIPASPPVSLRSASDDGDVDSVQGRAHAFRRGGASGESPFRAWDFIGGVLGYGGTAFQRPPDSIMQGTSTPRLFQSGCSEVLVDRAPVYGFDSHSTWLDILGSGDCSVGFSASYLPHLKKISLVRFQDHAASGEAGGRGAEQIAGREHYCVAAFNNARFVLCVPRHMYARVIAELNKLGSHCTLSKNFDSRPFSLLAGNSHVARLEKVRALQSRDLLRFARSYSHQSILLARRCSARRSATLLGLQAFLRPTLSFSHGGLSAGWTWRAKKP